jgi:hypothetical protein
MFRMDLNWKEFNIDLRAFEAFMRPTYSPNYQGSQGSYTLELYFDTEPSQEDKDAIQAYWDGILVDSAETLSYQSKDQVKAASDLKRESAKAKLAALGLDADELKALLG